MGRRFSLKTNEKTWSLDVDAALVSKAAFLLSKPKAGCSSLDEEVYYGMKLSCILCFVSSTAFAGLAERSFVSGPLTFYPERLRVLPGAANTLDFSSGVAAAQLSLLQPPLLGSVSLTSDAEEYDHTVHFNYTANAEAGVDEIVVGTNAQPEGREAHTVMVYVGPADQAGMGVPHIPLYRGQVGHGLVSEFRTEPEDENAVSWVRKMWFGKSPVKGLVTAVDQNGSFIVNSAKAPRSSEPLEYVVAVYGEDNFRRRLTTNLRITILPNRVPTGEMAHAGSTLAEWSKPTLPAVLPPLLYRRGSRTSNFGLSIAVSGADVDGDAVKFRLPTHFGISHRNWGLMAGTHEINMPNALGTQTIKGSVSDGAEQRDLSCKVLVLSHAEVVAKLTSLVSANKKSISNATDLLRAMASLKAAAKQPEFYPTVTPPGGDNPEREAKVERLRTQLQVVQDLVAAATYRNETLKPRLQAVLNALQENVGPQTEEAPQ
jgi:hypothetical protein